MRQIDADALADNIAVLLERNGELIDEWLANCIIDEIESAPTIEPTLQRVESVEIKHGHWTIEDIITYERSYGGILYEPVYKCSCCGRVTESYVRGDEPIMPEDADFPEFCGNCGAYMGETK